MLEVELPRKSAGLWRGLGLAAFHLEALLLILQLATAIGMGVLVGLLDRLELRIYLLQEKVRRLLLK